MTIFSERGVALIVVLWVTVLLTVMAGGFTAIVRTEARGLVNYQDESQAYFLARSGVNLAIKRLIDERIDGGVFKGTPMAKRWLTDSAPRKFLIGDDGFVEISISDESGKLNINDSESKSLKNLFRVLDLDEDTANIIAASILDWLDDNNFHRLNGAEDDYYGALSEPYESMDAPMTTVEELLWVRGVTPEIFYGESGGREEAGLRKLFTVYTHKKTVNINSASVEVLTSLPGIDISVAQRIVLERREREFKSVHELSEVGAELSVELGNRASFLSEGFYTIVATGGFSDSPISQTVKAVVEITKEARYRVLFWKDLEPKGKSLI